MNNIKARRWILHLVVWGVFLLPRFIPMVFNGASIEDWSKQSTVLVMCLFFYLHYFLLIPSKWNWPKGLLYLLTSSISILVAAYLITEWVSEVNNYTALQYKQRLGFGLSDFAFIALLANLVFMAEKYVINQVYRAQYAAQKAKTEMLQLRNQINPHFLFNSINTIYALVKKKSPLAEEAIVVHSDILRYLIESSEKDLVSVKDEVSNINSYVHLYGFRLREEINVSLNINGESELNIPPLILLSIIENMFKHGDHSKNGFFVINIALSDEKITLVTENAISKVASEGMGIGLSTIEKRMQLEKGLKSDLRVISDEHKFKAELKIWKSK